MAGVRYGAVVQVWPPFGAPGEAVCACASVCLVPVRPSGGPNCWGSCGIDGDVFDPEAW